MKKRTSPQKLKYIPPRILPAPSPFSLILISPGFLFIYLFSEKKMNSKIQYKQNQDFINNQLKIEEVNKKVESNNNIEYKDHCLMRFLMSKK